MRRLTQHAIVALAVTGLGAGVVAGSLNASSAADGNARVAVPLVAPTTAGEQTPERTVRDSRDADRNALTGKAEQQAATKRAEVLAEQQGSISEQAAAIKKHKAAEAAAKKKAAAEAKAKAAAAKKKKAAAEGYSADTTEPREIARQIMKNKYDWGSESDFKCYDLLIKSESQWDVHATNPSSGAYGIPQSLPGNKMASEGSDWKTNPATQIKWGLDYVKERYKTPCSAWSFKQGHNWY